MKFPKKIAELLLVVALLLPHLFLNIRHTQDWGDDFAMYLIEAKNIAEHKPVGETRHVSNPNVMLGPVNYPVGYPLLISPLVKNGIDYYKLNLLQSVFLIIALFFGFVFLRNFFSRTASILMTLILAYNPSLMGFKIEVLSDIAFWMFLNMIILLVLKNRAILGIVLLAALTGFSIHLRSIGYVLALSSVLFWLINDLKNKTISTEIKKYTIYIVTLLVVFFGIKILYPVNSDYPFSGNRITLDNIASQLSYNVATLGEYFKYYRVKDYYFIPLIFAAFFISFLLLGFALELKRNAFSFLNILTVLSVGIVIVYPFGDAGYRLILPLIFVFSYYFIIGFGQTLSKLELRGKTVVVIGAFIYMATYIKPNAEIHENGFKPVDGPVTMEFAQLLNFMNKNNIKHKMIGVDKSRALALYSDNKFASLSDSCFAKDITNLKLDYVINHYTQTSELKKQLAEADTARLKSIYNNAAFKMYEVRKPSNH